MKPCKGTKYRFFQHTACEYFPCHETSEPARFNCLMCFCPLYYIDDCGGDFDRLQSGIKDCTRCLLPHYDYNFVVDKIEEKNKQK